MLKALFKHTLCKFLSTKNSVYSNHSKFKTILLENLNAWNLINYCTYFLLLELNDQIDMKKVFLIIDE